ncbi:hypothetical protein GCG54_00013183 [Colletotrichum gloeosporioides]|uniref:Uncharacterized protein n=1 Tax=Colletotrichum gloeosporioides TaxID=474922 RepID=A0A8H4C797_COLGL|nr:uncharacterized protein GCG54_00013183 [Colletotrichum gloeosporioides]KAF3798443.1 hypothetical protein GCG54_00013183 [Colletotrichum gloeosporioides]
MNEGNVKVVTNEANEERVCNALHRFYANNPHFNTVNGGQDDRMALRSEFPSRTTRLSKNECMRADVGRLTPEDREKSQWIMSTPKVSNWLRLDESNILGVRAKNVPDALYHPLSFTAALLTETLQRSTEFPVFSTESCAENKRLMKKSTEKPNYAIKLFRGLLELLEDDDVVFTILDSWSRLLGDRIEADKVIEKLSQTTKIFPRLAIKILVLDPLPSDSIHESADSELYLPDEIDGWKNHVSLSLLKASNERMLEDLKDVRNRKRELDESDSETYN